MLGDDIAGFCTALAGGEGAQTYRDKWREQLNRNVAEETGPAGRLTWASRTSSRARSEWRAHLARVKALPPRLRDRLHGDPKYYAKVGPVDLLDGSLLMRILDFFEEGAAESARGSANSSATTSPAFAATT